MAIQLVMSICFSTPCNDKHKVIMTAVAFWKSSSFAECVLYMGNQRHLVLIPKASNQFASSFVFSAYVVPATESWAEPGNKTTYSVLNVN